MTEQEAIKLLEIRRSFTNSGNAGVSAIDMAISALEKQIAVSRIIIEGKYFCPKCKNLMPHPGYCGCGQKVY